MSWLCMITKRFGMGELVWAFLAQAFWHGRFGIGNWHGRFGMGDSAWAIWHRRLAKNRKVSEKLVQAFTRYPHC